MSRLTQREQKFRTEKDKTQSLEWRQHVQRSSALVHDGSSPAYLDQHVLITHWVVALMQVAGAIWCLVDWVSNAPWVLREPALPPIVIKAAVLGLDPRHTV